MNASLTEPKCDLNSAVKTALKFFRKSFEPTGKLSNVQLEEIELSDDEKFWLITVGYDNPAAQDLIREKLLLARLVPTRKYKVVRVDADTGRPISIKIRPGV